MILRRLQEKQPHYNVTKWCKEDDERRQMLGNMCEYPYMLGEKTNNSFTGTQSQSNLGPNSTQYAN